MTALEIYGIYLGMKLHFDGVKYDYSKYGPMKVKEESISRFYLMLSAMERKVKIQEEFEDRLIGIFRNKTVFVNKLFGGESEKWVSEYQAEKSGFTYNLKNDIQTILEAGDGDIVSTLKTSNPFGVPVICDLLMNGRIKYHSYAAIDSLFKFNVNVNPMVFPDYQLSVERYKILQNFDRYLVASMVKPFLKLEKE